MPTYRCSNSLTRVCLTLITLAATATPTWSQTGGSNYIYGIWGDVLIGRYLIRPDRAFEGALLPTNYQIRVNANSGVTLVCSNSTSHSLGSGTHRVSAYCPTRNSRRPGRRNSARDPFNVRVPYVLTPRNTALLSADDLTIRWNPISDATQYEVKITGRDVNWTSSSDDTQLAYSGTEDFRFDYRYTVVVTTDTGLSSETGLPMGFTVLPPAEVARVTSQVDEIKALQLEPDTEALALALMYLDYQHTDPERRSYALNQSVLDVLQARIDAGSENSQVYLLQADTYLGVGLPLLARERYLQALALAERNDLREQQALSYMGLGDVAEGQTEYVDAIRYLQAAKTLYESLEDLEQVEELETRLASLREEIGESALLESAL